MKNIRKLNNILFDAAPPLGFFVLAALIFIVPIIILLIVFTMRLIRKAAAGSKRNKDIENGNGDSAQTGNEGK